MTTKIEKKFDALRKDRNEGMDLFLSLRVIENFNTPFSYHKKKKIMTNYA